MKVSIKGFIEYKKSYAGDNDCFSFHYSQMGEYGYVTVMPYVIEVEVQDDFDPREGQIEILKAKKQKATADFQAMVTQIDRQIGELTALEFTA